MQISILCKFTFFFFNNTEGQKFVSPTRDNNENFILNILYIFQH